MSYATVGTIKSINLASRTFKLDPISKYRFEVKDGDENSLKIVFADELSGDPDDLKLVPKDTPFPFDVGLESAMAVLKQGKVKIKVFIEESCLAGLMRDVADNDNGTGDDANAKKKDNDGKTEKQMVNGGLKRDFRIEVL